MELNFKELFMEQGLLIHVNSLLFQLRNAIYTLSAL